MASRSACLREPAQGQAVQRYLALIRVDQPPGQARQRRLAGSRPAHHGDRAAAWNGEVEPAEHRLAAAQDRHAAQPQPSRAFPAAVRAVTGPRLGEQPGGAPAPAPGAAEPVELSDAGPEPDGEHGVLARGGQLARRDAVLRELDAGHGEHDDLQDRSDDHALGGGPGLDPPGGVAPGAQCGQRRQYALLFLAHGSRRGDGARSGQRVEQTGRDRSLSPLVAGADVGGVTDERAQDQGERRESRGEGDYQPGVDQPEREHAADRGDDGGDGHDHAGGCGAGVGRAADDAADRVAGAEAPQQPGAAAEDMVGQAAGAARRSRSRWPFPSPARWRPR